MYTTVDALETLKCVGLTYGLYDRAADIGPELRPPAKISPQVADTSLFLGAAGEGQQFLILTATKQTSWRGWRSCRPRKKE